jgi:CRP/FNR family cyclic AMP-dependent transcriptional regulator
MTAAPTTDPIIEFLMRTPMFDGLSESDVLDVVHAVQVQRVRAGQVIFDEGDAGDAWFVIQDGEIVVSKALRQGSQELARLGPRSCFGEMAILDGSVRSATVAAASDAVVLRFPRRAFDALLSNENLVAYKIVLHMAKVLAERQRETTARFVALLERPGSVDLDPALGPILQSSSATE